jgi:multidrug efflux pump subunit AcrA (membrane-fusion protein)
MATKTKVLVILFCLAALGGGGWWFASDSAVSQAIKRNGMPIGKTAFAQNPKTLERVSSLGRIEPRDGVIRVAGPPRPAVVIKELRVEEGDFVRKDQVIAVLLGIQVQRAEVLRLDAKLANAEWELERNQELFSKQTISESALRSIRLTRDVAAADLQRAKAELELFSVMAPIEGQILEIHARPSERVDEEGILELGDTTAMYAIAEVYETDIGRVRIGQNAVIRSPALPRDLTGRVERIGMKIGKKDVLSTDPVADADARVVEVDIRLSEPELAAALTNMRVDVIINTAAEPASSDGT